MTYHRSCHLADKPSDRSNGSWVGMISGLSYPSREKTGSRRLWVAPCYAFTAAVIVMQLQYPREVTAFMDDIFGPKVSATTLMQYIWKSAGDPTHDRVS